MREDPDSTAVAPRQLRVPRVGRLLFVAAVSIVLAAGTTIGVPHWRKLRLIEIAETNGGFVQTEYAGPRWLAKWVGTGDRALFNRVTGVSADDVNDDFLDLAVEQPHLLRLSVSGHAVTRSGLRRLTSARKLEKLALIDIALVDDDLMFLVPLTNLRELRLPHNGIEGRGLRHARGLKQLQVLDLFYCPIDNVGLREIARLKSLEHLNLGGTAVTDSALHHLRELPSLVTLGLYGTGISNDGLIELARIRSLRETSLADSRVTERGLSYLRDARPDVAVVGERRP